MFLTPKQIWLLLSRVANLLFLIRLQFFMTCKHIITVFCRINLRYWENRSVAMVTSDELGLCLESVHSDLQRNCGSYWKYCLKTLLKHTYLWKHILLRHPQPFILASFGEIQALIRTLLFSISLAVVWVEHCFIRAWNSPVPPVGLAGFKRGGVASRCVLFKWVWSLEETAHELPHAANKKRNVEIAVLLLHIKCY